ncbi:MAG: mutT [Verrucomicrobiales bacterium]|nr:mutT [Verrucomicrobiales bacterium]
MKPQSQPIEVAAGLIFKDGRLLIAQRKEKAHLGGLWEFPGGKKEHGESLPDCLVREIHEELQIQIVVDSFYQQIDHRYPDKFVRLHFYLCRWQAGQGSAIGCQDFKWVGLKQLAGFTFPAADAALLSRLLKDDAIWK